LALTATLGAAADVASLAGTLRGELHGPDTSAPGAVSYAAAGLAGADTALPTGTGAVSYAAVSLAGGIGA
jgi:hypothetical protein